MMASSLDSASRLLNWSNALYIGGAALTVVSAMYLFYETRAIAAGKRAKFYFLSEIIVLFAATVSLIGTIGAVHYSDVVSHLKDLSLDQFKLATQQHISADEAMTANANAAAASANQRAEEAKLQASTAETKAGLANAAAERERTLRLKLEGKVSGIEQNASLREITQEQMETVKAALSDFLSKNPTTSKRFLLFVQGDSYDTIRYSEKVRETLTHSGLEPSSLTRGPDLSTGIGILVPRGLATPPLASAIHSAFLKANIESVLVDSNLRPGIDFAVVVGLKRVANSDKPTAFAREK